MFNVQLHKLKANLEIMLEIRKQAASATACMLGCAIEVVEHLRPQAQQRLPHFYPGIFVHPRSPIGLSAISADLWNGCEPSGSPRSRLRPYRVSQIMVIRPVLRP